MLAAAERRHRKEQRLVHLQYCGDFAGTPAGEIQAGDCLAWNYGTVYDVVAVRPVSAQFVEVSERKHGEPGGQVYARRLRKDRLVVRCVPGGRAGTFRVR